MALSVVVQCERVDGECEAEQVEVLAGVADAVGAAEPHGVVEVAVDGFGVVAAGEEAVEVGVSGGMGRRFSANSFFSSAV